jgi:hypothetical protein
MPLPLLCVLRSVKLRKIGKHKCQLFTIAILFFFFERRGLHYNLNPNGSPITENTKKENK